ncbi:MAG: phage tail protein, partial [Planctomycetota bacterium]
NDQPLAYNSIEFVQQEFDGSSDVVAPVAVGKDFVFVLSDDRTIKSLFWNTNDVDGYSSDELSLLVPHLLENRKVVDWAYQEFPSSVIWLVMDDGELLSLTFLRDQKVVAWARHDTDGDVTSVAAVPGANGTDVYAIVNRPDEDPGLIGPDYWSVERMTQRASSRAQDSMFLDWSGTYDDSYDLEDFNTGVGVTNITITGKGFATDDIVAIDGVEGQPQLDLQQYKLASLLPGGLGPVFELYDLSGNVINTEDKGKITQFGKIRNTTTAITGADWLENKDVAILADGQVIANPLDKSRALVTVESGGFELGARYATVHYGLPYSAELQTLRFAGPGGSLQGQAKSISDVTLRSKGTIHGEAGPSRDQLLPIKQRQYEAWGNPTDPLSGDSEHLIEAQWNTDGYLYYRQQDPLPVTLLALIMNVEVGS